VLVAFHLLAQLVGFAHLAYVSHVTCAEHGELIEVRSSSGGMAAIAGAPAVRQSAAAEEGHGHDHCIIALARRDRAFTESSALPFGAVPLQAPLALPLVERIEPPAVAVILIAPKNSPPV
jgi:hypothetical protein